MVYLLTMHYLHSNICLMNEIRFEQLDRMISRDTESFSRASDTAIEVYQEIERITGRRPGILEVLPIALNRFEGTVNDGYSNLSEAAVFGALVGIFVIQNENQPIL